MDGPTLQADGWPLFGPPLSKHIYPNHVRSRYHDGAMGNVPVRRVTTVARPRVVVGNIYRWRCHGFIPLATSKGGMDKSKRVIGA